VFGYLGIRMVRLSDAEWGSVPEARSVPAPATV
jgi:hypothetical protein